MSRGGGKYQDCSEYRGKCGDYNVGSRISNFNSTTNTLKQRINAVICLDINKIDMLYFAMLCVLVAIVTPIPLYYVVATFLIFEHG